MNNTALDSFNIQPLGHTCGIACWTAQEDVCHCSCGGVNHGCMRNEGGVQPARSRKIKGVFYELHSVVKGFKAMMAFRQQYYNDSVLSSWNTTTQNATEKEINAWPELAAYRGSDSNARYDRYVNPVILIWVKSNKYK